MLTEKIKTINIVFLMEIFLEHVAEAILSRCMFLLSCKAKQPSRFHQVLWPTHCITPRCGSSSSGGPDANTTPRQE